MKSNKVLIIDDDQHICRIIETAFQRDDVQIFMAHDGQSGLRAFYKHQPNLVLLDIMMPDIDGWEVAKRIRQLSDVPIIMLTALQNEDDIVRGLDDGAIDYVTKPFSLKVLTARARAALRQAALAAQTAKPLAYRDEYLIIDLEKRKIHVDGKVVRLSVKEYDLLTLLLENSGKVLTFEEILSEIWGPESSENADYVRVYIWHLRKKIEKDLRHPVYIQTEYGIGYRFEGTPSGQTR